MDEPSVRRFRDEIIKWYENFGAKELPWRNSRDPWSVLIAAFLLRKTTATQVAKVYRTFLEEFPSPKSVLHADVHTIERLLRPLGIHRQRARLLKELARHIEELHGGQIPSSKEELMALPGIGRYIASEVLLAVHGQPEPLLDRNMARVIARVFGVKLAKRPHTDPELWAFAKSLLPESPDEARSFCYGVLDLARKICTAKNPNCSGCPLREICRSALSKPKGGAVRG
jgi:A/G-specific adenine glycosylase